MDFVHDALFDGRRFRILTIVDNFSRVSPALEADSSLTGERVVEVLEGLKVARGLPKIICVDNGTEFTGRVFDAWAHANNIKLDYSRPGKPTDNEYIESFNGKFRDECLNSNWFASLEEARDKIEQWRIDYNMHRPHSALCGRSPQELEQTFNQETPKKQVI